jgi:hypothetical protein
VLDRQLEKVGPMSRHQVDIIEKEDVEVIDNLVGLLVGANLDHVFWRQLGTIKKAVRLTLTHVLQES